MTDTPSGALAIRAGQDQWDAKQRAALASMGMRDIDPATLAVFMHFCQRTGLDPFAKQICLIKRREKIDGQWVDKWAIQVQIAGLQVIRDRVAERLGVTVEYEDTIWYGPDSSEHTVWLEDSPPAACRFTVLKDGRRFPAIVRYKAMVQTKADGNPNSMWSRMDAEQLEKCAEAKALRRAFPNDLAGVYIEDEPATDGYTIDTPSNGNGHAVQAPRRTVAGAVEAQAATRTSAAPGMSDADSMDQLMNQASTRAPEPAPTGDRTRISAKDRNTLNELLDEVRISTPAAKQRLLSEFTGRNIQALNQLTTGEGHAIAGLIRRELETSGGDIQQAHTELWALANANLTDPRDDHEPADQESNVPDTPDPDAEPGTA